MLAYYTPHTQACIALQALSGFLSIGNMVNIYIARMTGRRPFLVSDAMPFCALISAYAAFVKVPLMQLRIFLNSRQCHKDSQESLKDMGVVDGSVVYVLLKLRGD